MRRYYPYFEDQTFDNLNDIQESRGFLSEVAQSLNQKRYVRITLLDWYERPLKEIQGEVSSGTITKSGSSSVRRTCSLTVAFNGGDYNADDIDAEFSINKKVFMEVGVKNYTSKWTEYPILWFPQGVFFISSFSLSSSASSSFTANMSLKDKMCGLNGDVGGRFPAAVILDSEDTQNASGKYIATKVRIYNIIREMVHHYGGEPLENILIEDVPLKIKRVVRWMGSNPLYLYAQSEDGYVWYEASLEKKSGDVPYKTYQQNMDCGYVYDDFVYTSDLTMNLGDSVVTALDKIKSYLGNYEYYYDVFGMFHFREIKNYLNTTQAEEVLSSMSSTTRTNGNYKTDGLSANTYLVDVATPKVVYSFDDKNDIISITSQPRYDNIKNDYIIQGLRSGTSENAAITVRYHLAIDKKPATGLESGHAYYNLLFYQETYAEATDSTDTVLGEVRPIFPQTIDTRSNLPAVGNFNLIYHIHDENAFVYWDDDQYKDVSVVQYYADDDEDESTYSANTAITVYGGYTTHDWRTELYLQGLLTTSLGIDSTRFYNNMPEIDKNFSSTSWIGDVFRQSLYNNVDVDYYFEELDAFWPQIYDMVNQRFYGDDADNPELLYQTLCDGNFYLDFIDPQTSGLGEFSVQNIGRRTDTLDSDDVNCLFQPEIPDIVWLNADDYDPSDAVANDGVSQASYAPTNAPTIAQCNADGQPWSQVRGEIFENFYTGGYKNGAFDCVKSELWLHTTYQKTLTITAIPLFSLEPNSRVRINDANTNTYGDFMVSQITIPLNSGSTMSLTCSECVQQM